MYVHHNLVRFPLVRSVNLESVCFCVSSFDDSLSCRIARVCLCAERIGAKGEWESFPNPDSKACQLSQCGHQSELVSD